jgi:hypothetical protein
MDTPETPRNRVLPVLRYLGFHELRPAGSAGWTPTAEADGYGTTSTTKIIVRDERARLVDRSTGRQVATARKACPLHPTRRTDSEPTDSDTEPCRTRASERPTVTSGKSSTRPKTPA